MLWAEYPAAPGDTTYCFAGIVDLGTISVHVEYVYVRCLPPIYMVNIYIESANSHLHPS